MEADKVKKKIEKIKIRYQMELDTLIKITKSIVVSDERLIGAIKQRYQEKLDKVQKFYSSFLNLMLDNDREFLIKCANERGALKNDPVYSKGETNWFVKNIIKKRTITESEYGEELMGLSKKINDMGGLIEDIDKYFLPYGAYTEKYFLRKQSPYLIR